MGKVGYKLPDKYKQIAIDNGISLQTVYSRINHGWELEKAVNKKPSKKIRAIRSKTGELITSRKKYPISIHFYEDKEEILDDAIAQSGKTRSEFIADVLEDYLDKWEKKKRN
jgi:hypothetical protein